jgi:hypothetical protein
MLFLHNPPARLVAVPAHGPGPVDTWTVARVPYPGRPGPRALDLVPAGLVRGPRSVARWPWTGRAGGLVARYLVRA